MVSRTWRSALSVVVLHLHLRLTYFLKNKKIFEKGVVSDDKV